MPARNCGQKSSAMMTGEQVGVGHDPQRGAAYVENWVAVLEKDPHEIRRAAGEAQKMTNLPHGPGRSPRSGSTRPRPRPS